MSDLQAECDEGLEAGGQGTYYGIAIALLFQSLDHSLFTRLIPPYNSYRSRY